MASGAQRGRRVPVSREFALTLNVTYPQWKAPSEDGQCLLWPAGSQLLRTLEQNARRLADAQSPRIGGVPLSELRRRQRQALGHAQSAGPLIANGHQTELYHPGVWVKNVVIDHLAKASGGRAIHFSVDTDAPKHLKIHWPGGSAALSDQLRQDQAAWSGLLHSPSVAHLRALGDKLDHAATAWNFSPVYGPFLETMIHLAEQGVALAPAVVNAMHVLDRHLGLEHDALVASPLFSGAPYLLYVYHLLAHAPRLALAYNRALADYRRREQIASPGRPMPDLKMDHQNVEVPFWLDDLAGGKRRRAAVALRGEQSVLVAGGEEFTFANTAQMEKAADGLAAFLQAHQLRLSPRALTLTMFFRLLAVDLFVHGIGGGHYDQVTDQLIADFFDFGPPDFAVATATLFFPSAVGRTRVCLTCLRHQGHQLRHQVMGQKKSALLEEIAALPRRSMRRRAAYYDMHGQMAEAALRDPALNQWQTTWEQSQADARVDRQLFDREIFYALQPRDRLLALMRDCPG